MHLASYQLRECGVVQAHVTCNVCFMRSDAHTHMNEHVPTAWHVAVIQLVVQWSLSDLVPAGPPNMAAVDRYVCMYNDILTGTQGCFRQRPLQPHSVEWSGVPLNHTLRILNRCSVRVRLVEAL